MQVNVKSNEITAIPELLDLLDIEGLTVTIDAIPGCIDERGRLDDQDRHHCTQPGNDAEAGSELPQESQSRRRTDTIRTYADVSVQLASSVSGTSAIWTIAGSGTFMNMPCHPCFSIFSNLPVFNLSCPLMPTHPLRLCVLSGAQCGMILVCGRIKLLKGTFPRKSSQRIAWLTPSSRLHLMLTLLATENADLTTP